MKKVVFVLSDKAFTELKAFLQGQVDMKLKVHCKSRKKACLGFTFPAEGLMLLDDSEDVLFHGAEKAQVVEEQEIIPVADSEVEETQVVEEQEIIPDVDSEVEEMQVVEEPEVVPVVDSEVAKPPVVEEEPVKEDIQVAELEVEETQAVEEQPKGSPGKKKNPKNVEGGKMSWKKRREPGYVSPPKKRKLTPKELAEFYKNNAAKMRDAKAAKRAKTSQNADGQAEKKEETTEKKDDYP